MTNKPPPKSDNNLINGKMDFDCTKIPAGGPACTPNAGIAKFNFQSGKTHRLRLINAGADATLRFSIDNHNMTVIAQDFVPVVPFTTNVVTLGVSFSSVSGPRLLIISQIGQRTDVIVKGTMSPTSSVFMRSNLTDRCASVSQPYAVAAIYYEKANKTKTPDSTAQVFDNTFCGNVSKLLGCAFKLRLTACRIL